ncbi:ABC transporter substrate-binding protein [Bacillus sp. FJAT-42376]|uniref:ABC transporter substrate-binding protein n=1 Tax=Bacillus sp. FJAT-42376 TaxID=2014076 RepID=UPI000F4D9E3F|nr:ABC transporter substrate-binding protein [Bacillus sp. FJAT-42376]AZB41440.1 ABC transporter substrate-binding protein [Bacillus sp. FJAT-42376]
MGKKTGVWVSMAVAAGLMLSGCGNKEGASGGESGSGGDSGKTYKIGVTQIVEHPSLDDAYKGFKEALKDKGIKAEFDVKNAQGDASTNTTIAATLVSQKPDLIFANSTPSAQAALSATKDIPIVFSSVTDPVGAELVASLEKPGGNVTGTIDSHPEAIPSTMKFIKDELGGKKVGMLYNAGEQNSVSQVEAVKKLMGEMGLEAVTASVSTTADVKQAAEALAGKIDAFYIVTDNTVISAIESVVSVSNDKKIPLLTADLDSLKRGAFAAYGFQYHDIGYQAGEMAADILKGKKAGEIAVEVPKNLKLMINKKAAEAMGVKIKPEWDKNAEYTE